MVEEAIDGEILLNQPAGHLERDETLVEAMVRETMEETGWEVTPVSISGIYHYRAKTITYHRFTFIAEPVAQRTLDLDPDITACHWLSLEDLGSWQHRSPIVQRCVDDYLAGQRAPLDLLTHL